MKTDAIHISDRACVDCGGEPVLFAVPDKVWRKLGLTMKDWFCLDCFARRLDPANPATSPEVLARQIVWKRRHFGLKRHNVYGGWMSAENRVLLPLERSFVYGTSRDFESLTAAQCGEKGGAR
jgi:hypothetical protein